VNGVFLDSAGLIALWNRRDQWHEAAAASFIALSPAAALVTTSYIVAECGNTFSRSEIRELLGDLSDQLAMEDTLIFPNDAGLVPGVARVSKRSSRLSQSGR